MITYQDKQFYIDGKPMFLFGGELHYFRVPKTQWKDRIQKIKDAGFHLVSTYIPWIWHEVSNGEFDFTGDTLPEKDLASFIEYVKEAGLYLLVRPGPYVMAETVNSGIPIWLINEHEEIWARKENGDPHPSRGLVSYMHPVYLNYVDRWYEQVFAILSKYEINHGGPIIMTQYDNEVGMFHWVTSQGDYSDVTISYFKQYLLEEYDTVFFKEELKQYDSFESMIQEFLQGKTDKEQSFVINQEFKTFFRYYIKLYLEELIKIASKYGSCVPPVVNVHGFSSQDYAKRGNRYPVGLSQLYETKYIKDVIIAGDYYVGNIVSENFFDVIIANSFTEAMQPSEQPLFSAEFQSGFQNGVPRLQPTTHDLKTRLSIATGMNAINYYMFVGGENYEEIGLISRRHDWQAPIGMDGSLRRHYYKLKHIAGVIDAYGDALLKAKMVHNTHMFFDPNYYMTEFNNQYTQSQAHSITRERQTYLFNGIGKSLAYKNVAFHSIDGLLKAPIDVNEVPTLIAFSTDWMSASSQQKLVDYMHNGGKLFLYPRIPIKDLTDIPCTILKDAIDVTILEDSYTRVHVLKEDSVNCHRAQVYDVKEGFASLDLDHSEITGFHKTIGSGEIIVFGMAIKSDWDYIDDIVYDVLQLFDIKQTASSDEWLQISKRESADGAFYFIHNFEEFEKVTPIYVDNQPLFDGYNVRLPMRHGVIYPVNWIVTDCLKVVYGTVEVMEKIITDHHIYLTVRPTKVGDRLKVETEYELKPSEDYSIINGKIVLKQNKDTQITWRKNNA